jgi:hypothetical protein
MDYCPTEETSGKYFGSNQEDLSSIILKEFKVKDLGWKRSWMELKPKIPSEGGL